MHDAFKVVMMQTRSKCKAKILHPQNTSQFLIFYDEALLIIFHNCLSENQLVQYFQSPPSMMDNYISHQTSDW